MCSLMSGSFHSKLYLWRSSIWPGIVAGDSSSLQSNIPLRNYTVIYFLFHSWWASGDFQCGAKCYYGHPHKCLLVEYEQISFHGLGICLALVDIAKQFCLHHTLTSNIQGFPLLLMFVNTCHFTSNLHVHVD